MMDSSRASVDYIDVVCTLAGMVRILRTLPTPVANNGELDAEDGDNSMLPLFPTMWILYLPVPSPRSGGVKNPVLYELKAVLSSCPLILLNVNDGKEQISSTRRSADACNI